MARQSSKRAVVGLEALESRQVLSAAAPTAELQYALELVNLARTNPAAAADRLANNLSSTTKSTIDFYGVNLNQTKGDIASAQARQPLAWNDQLAAAAQAHSQDMAANGFQSHTGSDGSSPAQRVAKAGYTDSIRTAENAYAYADSIDNAIDAFLIDWGVADKGHRRNILEPDNVGDDSFKEIGIGAVQSKRLGMGLVMTQNFGVRRNAPPQLLGVVYTDKDRDKLYSVGEGQGGATINLTSDDGKTQEVQSAPAGGYQIPLAPGHYKMTVTLGDQVVDRRDVQIGKRNVKADVVLGGSTTPPATPTGPLKLVQSPSNIVVSSSPSKPTVVVSPILAPADVPVSAPAAMTILSNSTSIVANGDAKSADNVLADAQVGFKWSSWRTIPKA